MLSVLQIEIITRAAAPGQRHLPVSGLRLEIRWRSKLVRGLYRRSGEQAKRAEQQREDGKETEAAGADAPAARLRWGGG